MSRSHPGSSAQHHVLEAMRAVLSDDHNYERGLSALRALVARIAHDEGDAELRDFAVRLSLALAQALERIARDEGLPVADLAEVWFVE